MRYVIVWLPCVFVFLSCREKVFVVTVWRAGGGGTPYLPLESPGLAVTDCGCLATGGRQGWASLHS